MAPSTVWAQGATATLTGTVVDESGAHVPGAALTLLNTATDIKRETVSSPEGSFVLPSLPPGTYTLRAQLEGFGPIQMENIVLNVDDRVAVRIQLKVAPVGESVRVVAPNRTSTSPAVSTVIDRQFVENLPLNGRTLQPLLELTPGVVLTRVSTTSSEGGQFSVNGQRTNANYFTIDGVSANTGVISAAGTSPGQGGSGSLPSLTALGTTNGLVSVDALQEFRIQTSTYAPEFGRTPGGQISMVTRSGTNAFSGSLFEYFRDDALDATDWFANRSGLPKARLSQHNFGGVFGGPILRNRTFFFGSYEGLRLTQPQTRTVTVVSMETRRTATPAIRALINAQPIPNGPDLGNGFARFIASYSDESRLDASSIRIDHRAGRHTFFGRMTYSPSYSQTREGPLSNIATANQTNTGATVGATTVLSGRLVHDFRANYTENDAPYNLEPDDFGGAQPPDPTTIFSAGQSPQNSLYLFQVAGGPSWRWGIGTTYKQRQMNFVDSLTFVTRAHEWKAGVDYRSVRPQFGGNTTTRHSVVFRASELSLGRALQYRQTLQFEGRQAAAFDNLSLFLQDNWRPASRLTITYGVRWELVPPPHSTEGKEAITLNRMDNLYAAPVAIAPEGTKLWDTRYYNFAPRLGASYVVSRRPGAELILRSGFGVFYDLGFGQIATTYTSYPFESSKLTSNVAFPFGPDVLAPPTERAFDSIIVNDRALRLPFTNQWNVSAEQAIGSNQTLTVSYVGADGYSLLKRERYTLFLVERPTERTPVWINRNSGYSDYRALQLQFRRRLHAGLQSLVAYTLGRSRDTSSSDGYLSIPAEKLAGDVDFGASDFDVRHVFSAAVTYQMKEVTRGPVLWRLVARNWGIDMMSRARSGFPIDVVVNVPFPPDTQSARPNVVAGQPFWIEDRSVPGGRRLNQAAFAAPPAGTQGDLKRGAVRGFGASQIDLAIRRTFTLPQRIRMQFRFEMFNLFNTPSFTDPPSTITSAGFGVSTQMLNRGFGGVNPFYQIGGPRSTQLAVKLLF